MASQYDDRDFWDWCRAVSVQAGAPVVRKYIHNAFNLWLGFQTVEKVVKVLKEMDEYDRQKQKAGDSLEKSA